MKAVRIIVLGLVISIFCGASASALTYRDGMDVQFTFDPTISLTLSSNTITIDNLIPGNTSTSYTILVNVETNNMLGYTLSAKVGGTGQTDASNSLVNTTYNTSFDSIANNASTILSSFADNKWGYTTATTVGNDSLYSGLLYNTDKIINQTTNYSGTAASGYPGTNTTRFTIGARAASTQIAGDYTNVITFTVVSNRAPMTINDLTYMQDFATLSSAEKTEVLTSMTQNQQYTLKDSRDQKDYYIAKLADGNVWMTQNLDFDIVNGGSNLDQTNTDVPSNWSDAGNLTNTYATGTTTWNYSTSAPQSYDPGDLCWNGVIGVYELSTGTTDCNASNKHYHIGNYYNWTAAVAMSDSSSYTQGNTDVDQSICPAGWRLPTNTVNKSYYNLVSTLSLTSGTSGNIQNSPVYFVYGGRWNRSSYDVGHAGSYWSSVVYGEDRSYELYFNRNGYLYPRNYADRGFGLSVRCVAR